MGKIIQFTKIEKKENNKRKIYSKIVGVLAVIASIVTILGYTVKDLVKCVLDNNAVVEESEINQSEDWQAVAEKK